MPEITKPKLERRQLDLAEFRALDGEAGGFSGYPAKWFEITSYGDIMLPGCCLNTIPFFLQNGFISHSHEWDMDEIVGMPMVAREDSVGLYSEMAYHSTEDAQEVRTIVRERMNAGKSVGLSVGFCCKSDVWISADSYDSELPKYIPQDKLAALMPQLLKLGSIRLITEIELYEYSVVTAPALKSAGVLESRDHKFSGDGHRDGLSFDEQLKAALGAVEAVVERRKAIDAVRRAETRVGKTHSAATLAKVQQMRDAAQACRDTAKACIEHCDSMLASSASADDATQGASLDVAIRTERLRYEALRRRHPSLLQAA